MKSEETAGRRDEATVAALRLIPDRAPDQLGFVVSDLGAAVQSWSLALGRQDWRVHTYNPETVQDLLFRGRPASFSIRLAMCGQNPQVEVIETLTGSNLYTEFVSERGYGLQHVGYFVPSIREITERMSDLGFEIGQAGRGYGLDGDGGFAYYDIPGLEVAVEFIEVPQRRRPSESVPLPKA